MTAPTPATNHEVSVLREHSERYRSVTLQTLDLVPDAKLDWRPLDALRTFAEQFVHIAQIEDFYIRGLLASDWNFSRLEPVAEPLTRKLIRERLNETRACTLEKLDTLPAARLDTLIVVPNAPVEWPLRSWLWYVVEHEIHHKAQLTLYLQRIGVAPPFFAYALPPGLRPDIHPR